MKNRDIETICHLSPQQKGMLFGTARGNEDGIFIEQYTCVLRGPLDVQAYRQAWQRVVDRHSILRTAFVWKEQEEPLQVVMREAEVPLKRQDLRGVAPADQRMLVEAYLNADRRQAFKLMKAPLMRLALLQLGDEEHFFVWTIHHILVDGWCRPILLNEVSAAYAALLGGSEPRLEPSRPYKDYIAWLRRQDVAQAESFWRGTLKGVTSPTPLGRPAGEGQPAPAEEGFADEEVRLPAQAVASLQALARRHRLTLNTLVQCAWALVLARYGGTEDVVFGTTVSGRPADLPGSENMIGLFINTLPFRAEVSPRLPFISWAARVQEQHAEMRGYEYCSEGQIHGWSEMPASAPLYESVLVFQNYPFDRSGAGPADSPLQIEQVRSSGARTEHALTLLVTAASEVVLHAVYNRARLSAQGASRALGHLASLLTGIEAAPDRPVSALLESIPDDEVPTFFPARTGEQLQQAAAYVAPRTPTEEVLARIWADTLGVEQLSVEANFFDLGGHSLLATHLIAVVRETFRVELPLGSLFEAPTVAEMATVIVQKTAEQVNDDVMMQALAEIEAASESRTGSGRI